VKPHDLKPPPGSITKSKRVGRGEGSGKGKTAGRGMKGTHARGEVSAFFEGGQMPLTRRLPKLKGFKPPSRTIFEAVNVKDLDRVSSNEIGPAEMRSSGLIRGNRNVLVKVLGTGDIDRKVRVSAHAFSESARSKIEAAGGGVELIEIKSRKKKKKRGPAK
jgi:large subunit ribosomal protein L15